MQDGDSVRVKTGRHTGLTGELFGEPGTWGVAIKPPDTHVIISVPYPPGIKTAEELLEPTPTADAIGGAPQPA